MNIDLFAIKDWMGEPSYRRSMKCYKEGYVESLIMDEQDSIWKEDKNILRFKGNVISMDGFNSYRVSVQFNESSGRITAGCSCEMDKNKGPCVHIGAVLLKYVEEYQGSIQAKKQSRELEALIEELRGISFDSKEYKRELALEIKLIDDRYANKSIVELKLGLGKMYVVKNIKSFLKDMYKGQAIEFGKHFTFDPSLHKFSETDEGIIEFLLGLWELEKEREEVYSRGYYGSSSVFSGKRLLLTDKLLYRLLSLAKEKSLLVEIDGQEHQEVKVLKEDLPIDFNVSMNNEVISLAQEETLPYSLDSSKRVFFYKGNLYLPGEKQLEIYHPLLRLLEKDKDNRLLINKKEGEKIASYLLPMVKKIARKVTLDERVQESFYETDLITTTYLDKRGDLVSAVMKFKYNDIEIDPLIDNESSQSDRILIRDIEREESCVRILESFGFSKAGSEFVMGKEEDMVAFIQEGLEKLQELSEVYYSESFKNIRLYGKANLIAGVRINNEKLLEFSFSLEGVEREELIEIFSSIREKKKYYRLKSGGFVDLQDNGLKDLTEVIDYLGINNKDILKDNILISKYNALYLDSKIKDSTMDYVKRSRDFRDLVNNVKDLKDIEYTLPEGLEGVMRNYQKLGFKWFKTLAAYGFGGILADEMGLGKTLQTIAFLASEVGDKPSLVIAPTSLIYNWEEEIKRFAPTMRVLVLSGPKGQREEHIEEINRYDIVITSYPLIRRDIDDYEGISFKYCILDEAQQIKNAASMNAASVKMLKAEGYFALTGTPMENSLTELWSIFDFIMPGYLLSHGKFTKLYESPIVKNQDKEALEELNRHIKPFILRRLKKEVLKELPPKIEHSLIVEMTEEQKKLYAAYLASAREELNNEIKDRGFNKSKIKLFSILTRLRQICCDPSVFIENYQGQSGKLLALYDLLQESIYGDHKILLFSQFTSVLKNIGEYLKEQGMDYLYLDGSTDSQERIALTKEFNTGDTRIFLISLKAGGTGLNLTGADTVIHFDPWWNPAVEDQATDRAHRIGQERTVEVIKLLAKGTIEEKIFKLQEDKKKIIQEVINDDLKEATSLNQMTQEDLEALFS